MNFAQNLPVFFLTSMYLPMLSNSIYSHLSSLLNTTDFDCHERIEFYSYTSDSVTRRFDKKIAQIFQKVAGNFA